MIIDKVQPYWTEEEATLVAELEEKKENILKALAPKKGTSYFTGADLGNYFELDKRANIIYQAVEDRYIKARSKKEIISDVKEIVNAITKEDFLEKVAVNLHSLELMRADGHSEESLKELKRLATANYENCYWYILARLRAQLNALAEDEELNQQAIRIVHDKVGLWYAIPQPAYIPMAHGKATDAFSFMSARNAEIDLITGNATIEKYGVQLAITKLRELNATLSISTDKLLSTAIASFTQHNDFRGSKKKELNRGVSIPLKEYAQLAGYDVIEHETSTPEEAEKERKRVKNQLDNARRAIRKDLNIIHASTLTWEEDIKGKSKDFARVSIATYTGIRNGEIQISFSPEIANYLAERNLITYYPTKLLGISGRKPTPYKIGKKLAEYYHQDRNTERGTNNRISIPALLAVTDLPSYEEVQATDRGHWAERIKEPFEKALDELTKEKIIKDWEYTHAKGVPLTDEEAGNITTYSDWINLYLLFSLTEEVDQTERLKAKREARAKQEKKKRAKKSKIKKE